MNTDYELRERIEAVSDAEGDEDNLLTVAIPPGASVGETLERVEEDHAEAEYIDSDGSSTDRRAVLDRARQHLHDYDETPENGLVLYVGALEGEGSVADYVFDDLPGPVAESTLEWGNEFDVEALETATDDELTYGLLVVERGGAALGELDGEVVYGDDRVDAALEYDAAETVLVSGDRSIEAICDYEERTERQGGDVVVVPPETEHGARFDETFGVAALLRFPIE